MKQGFFFTPYTKINSGQLHGLNLQRDSVRLLQGETVDINTDKDPLEKVPEAQAVEPKTDKCN